MQEAALLDSFGSSDNFSYWLSQLILIFQVYMFLHMPARKRNIQHNSSMPSVFYYYSFTAAVCAINWWNVCSPSPFITEPWSSMQLVYISSVPSYLSFLLCSEPNRKFRWIDPQCQTWQQFSQMLNFHLKKEIPKIR